MISMNLVTLAHSIIAALTFGWVSQFACWAPAVGSEPAAPLSQRYAGDQVDDVPDFQKHIVPMLGRLGCNGRACHGSFQGQGGFQLSLFGYDFKADHQALLDDTTGRVELDDIDESLILTKPTDEGMHEGGQRYELGSWQHHVLRRWLQAGAKFAAGEPQNLRRLEVIPNEIQFAQSEQTVPLRAIAHWQDGSVEDVTELCRFSSNDDSIAAINEAGQVQSGAAGDTHVVVYYDRAVVPVPILRPVGPVPTEPRKDTHPIDQLVGNKLDKLGVTPSSVCTDAEFIRRVSLDMTGILPSADEVRNFLADTSTDKREKLIDELLQSPGYAAWWATRFSDWTGNSEEQLNNVLPVRNAGSRLWYEWLRTRLAANMPYDELIEGMVTAQSRQPNESYLDYCESMTKACVEGNEELFTQREGMPLYWARRNFQKPEERAIGFAYAFLGVRIECAQCHKHPFDQWSKDDFDQFAKLFVPVRFNQNLVAADAKQDRDALTEKITGGKKLRGGDLRKAVYMAAQEGETVPFGELLVNTRSISNKAKKARLAAKKKGKRVPTLAAAQGRIIGQDSSLTLNQDPRGPLMEWLRSPENPYFAKAIVNRVWSNYFGIGIVDPTDDMNLANPPSNAPLLDHLASEFISHNFDLRWLHHTIVTSDTYQRSADTNSTNVLDRANFSHHIPRRLPAEVIYDSVILATGSNELADKLRDDLDDMAIAEGKPRRRNQQDFALEVFGQSIRESNCDCDRSNSPSLLQSIYLRNDIDMHKRLADRNGWVAQACKTLGVSGPKSIVDDRNQRRADAMRNQVVRRIRQFNQLPAAGQAKSRPQLVRAYNKTVSKLKQFGITAPALDRLIAEPGSWTDMDPGFESISESGSAPKLEKIVQDAYLRTLSRFPERDEVEISVAFIEESKSPADGLQSMLWALVNTKEFIISH